METEFSVPTLGERRDIADNELPIAALRLSQNVMRSEKGLLEIRPGYKRLFNGANPGGRIMGIGYFRSSSNVDRMLAANLTQAWHFDGSAWVNLTPGGNELSGTELDHVHFTTMPVSGV